MQANNAAWKKFEQESSEAAKELAAKMADARDRIFDQLQVLIEFDGAPGKRWSTPPRILRGLPPLPPTPQPPNLPIPTPIQADGDGAVDPTATEYDAKILLDTLKALREMCGDLFGLVANLASGHGTGGAALNTAGKSSCSINPGG